MTKVCEQAEHLILAFGSTSSSPGRFISVAQRAQASHLSGLAPCQPATPAIKPAPSFLINRLYLMSRANLSTHSLRGFCSFRGSCGPYRECWRRNESSKKPTSGVGLWSLDSSGSMGAPSPRLITFITTVQTLLHVGPIGLVQFADYLCDCAVNLNFFQDGEDTLGWLGPGCVLTAIACTHALWRALHDMARATDRACSTHCLADAI